MLNVAEVRDKAGFKFAVVKGTPADHASWWSFDDEQEVRDRHWHPKPGEIVLDVGAAFGSYALPALVAGARVVAFSPADFDTELLEKNLSLNPLLATRCLVVRDGLHERDGWFDPDHSTFVSDGPPTCYDTAGDLKGTIGHGTPGALQHLRVRSLDSFLQERPGIDRVDWIKMDVEGAELGVLRGGIECLRRHRPKLLIECHNFVDHEMEAKVVMFVLGLGLGYSGVTHPHHSVSHAFFEVKR